MNHAGKKGFQDVSGVPESASRITFNLLRFSEIKGIFFVKSVVKCQDGPDITFRQQIVEKCRTDPRGKCLFHAGQG